MQDDDVFYRESWLEVERRNRKVDALTGWAEISEGLDTDDDGYISEFDNDSLLSSTSSYTLEKHS